MNAKEFEASFKAQVERCNSLLLVKAKEYATEDRLHNFKRAAALKGETPRQALVGIMVKHTVSIFDMGLSDRYFSPAVWDEKVTDHMNYLFLLRAIIDDEEKEKSSVDHASE